MITHCFGQPSPKLAELFSDFGCVGYVANDIRDTPRLDAEVYGEHAAVSRSLYIHDVNEIS